MFRAKKIPFIIGLFIFFINYSVCAAAVLDPTPVAQGILDVGSNGIRDITKIDINKNPVAPEISDNTADVETARVIGNVAIGITAATVGVTAIASAAAVTGLGVLGGIILGIIALTSNDVDYNGLAAGDNLTHDYALWVTGKASNVKSKEVVNGSAVDLNVKSTTTSFMFTRHKDSGDLLGVFYRYSTGELSFSHANHYNTNHVLGLNGNLYLTDHLHLLGMASFIHSKMKGEDLTTKGKKTQMLKVEMEAAYDINVSERALLMPRMGFQYITAHRESYKTKDMSSFQARSFSHIDASADIMLQNIDEYKAIQFISSVTAGVQYPLWKREGALNFSVLSDDVSEDITLPIVYTRRTRAKAGCSLGALYDDTYHISISYVGLFSSKTRSHAGTLGFTVEF